MQASSTWYKRARNINHLERGTCIIEIDKYRGNGEEISSPTGEAAVKLIHK